MPKGDPAGYLPRVKQARKSGVGQKYRNSKFNPFAGGGVSAGQRIRRANGSNAPAEDDSDFDPKRHGNRRAAVAGRAAAKAFSKRAGYQARSKRGM